MCCESQKELFERQDICCSLSLCLFIHGEGLNLKTRVSVKPGSKKYNEVKKEEMSK